MAIACQTVTVIATGNLAGQVLDAGTNVAIGGATITIDGYSGVSAANSTYNISGIAPGTYTVTVSANGYTTRSYPNITINEGATTTLYLYLYTVSNITATAMTVTPISCLAPCNVTVSVTWRNNGETAGSFTPNITVDGVASSPAPYPSENLNGGASITHSFSVTNLSGGSHEICPLPN